MGISSYISRAASADSADLLTDLLHMRKSSGSTARRVVNAGTLRHVLGGHEAPYDNLHDCFVFPINSLQDPAPELLLAAFGLEPYYAGCKTIRERRLPYGQLGDRKVETVADREEAALERLRAQLLRGWHTQSPRPAELLETNNRTMRCPVQSFVAVRDKQWIQTNNRYRFVPLFDEMDYLANSTSCKARSIAEEPFTFKTVRVCGSHEHRLHHRSVRIAENRISNKVEQICTSNVSPNSWEGLMAQVEDTNPNALFDVDGSIVNPAFKDSRLERMSGARKTPRHGDYRTPTEVDKDRVLYSSYLKRLSGVSQIVSPTLRAQGAHSRLLHSLKVSNVAREIANDLCRHAAVEYQEVLGRRGDLSTTYAARIANFGGLDIAACEVGGLAHDMGHPPFGHAAERATDEWIRGGSDQNDGFEGNAQSIRILTRLDQRNSAGGRRKALDLTRVSVRAAMKYPWLRDYDDEARSRKFGVYRDDAWVLTESAKSVPDYIAKEGLMSVEACIVDIADDITYALHDLQDFYELGLIDFVQVRRHLMDAAAYLEREFLGLERVQTDNEFALAARRLESSPKFDIRQYIDALEWVANWIRETPDLHERFDRTRSRSAKLREEISIQMKGILSGPRIKDDIDEAERTQIVHLEDLEWHRLQVLKDVAVHSVISSPAIALHEYSQVAALMNVLLAFDKRVSEAQNSLPYPLRDFLDESRSSGDGSTVSRRLVADYVCGLTDANCLDLSRFVMGIEIPEIGRFDA